jgi:hypothetical protein
MRDDKACQECHGYGGHTEAVLDDGTGPWEPCWACGGTGTMTPAQVGAWLFVKRYERGQVKAREARRG